jgi:hypothetical protein
MLVPVGVQPLINSSLYEKKAVMSSPDGLGTWRYCESFSVVHCHGSHVAVGVVVGRRSSNDEVVEMWFVDTASAIFTSSLGK